VQERSATRIDDADVPFGLLDPDAPSVTPAGGPPVVACLVDGEVVTTVRRTSPRNDPLGLVRSLAAVTDAEADLGYSTAVDDPTDIEDVDVRAGVALVDFDERAEESVAAAPLLAVAQIVCTLTRQPGIERVAFTLAGEPLEVPTEGGELTADPVGEEAYQDVIR
jgi:spore germination protein GerM